MSNNTTIKDIAKIAKVSYSTVSRSLNDSPLVSESTKQKVVKLANQLHFEFNANARGLILNKSNAIALVLSDQFLELNFISYNDLLLKSYLDIFDKKNIDLILIKQKDLLSSKNRIIQYINSKKIDGLIFLVEKPSDETLSFLNEINFPSIFVYYATNTKLKNFNVVYNDYYKGGMMLASHLIKKGHTKFTIICFNEYHKEFSLRTEGFISEVKKIGGFINKLSCDLKYESAKKCCEDNISSIIKTTAVFGINDIIALGAMRALLDYKINIPKDIAIVGYDDSQLSKCCNPSLTTIHLNREEMVKLCIDNLLRQIREKDNNIKYVEEIVLDPILIERDST